MKIKVACKRFDWFVAAGVALFISGNLFAQNIPNFVSDLDPNARIFMVQDDFDPNEPHLAPGHLVTGPIARVKILEYRSGESGPDGLVQSIELSIIERERPVTKKGLRQGVGPVDKKHSLQLVVAADENVTRDDVWEMQKGPAGEVYNITFVGERKNRIPLQEEGCKFQFERGDLSIHCHAPHGGQMARSLKRLGRELTENDVRYVQTMSHLYKMARLQDEMTTALDYFGYQAIDGFQKDASKSGLYFLDDAPNYSGRMAILRDAYGDDDAWWDWVHVFQTEPSRRAFETWLGLRAERREMSESASVQINE